MSSVILHIFLANISMDLNLFTIEYFLVDDIRRQVQHSYKYESVYLCV